MSDCKSIGKRIKICREALGLTQAELAKKVGYKSNTTINKIELDINDIPLSKVKEFAKALNTTTAYLMGWEEDEKQNQEKQTALPRKKGVKIPVLGEVVAGVPIEAIEDILDYEEITEEMAAKGEHFALKVKGDSMEPVFYAEDIVIVRQQPTADSGDIVIALVNGDESTIKKLKLTDDGLMLIPANPAYEPMYYTRKQIDTLPVSIIGKVVELRRSF